MIPTVYIMRGGAPEKIGLEGHLYNIRLCDHCNLLDLDRDELNSILINGNYILPSDESDYNNLNDIIEKKYRSQVLLCKSNNEFLDYNKIKKSSEIYLNWDNNESGINFPYTYLVSKEYIVYNKHKVYKTPNESGSRGVLINPTVKEWSSFIHSKSSDEFLVQDKVPESGLNNKLDNYYTFDVQIKNKKILGYCFVLIPSNSYPRWIRGYIVKNKKLDNLIKKFSSYLINYVGVTDGFINVDGVTTKQFDEFWMYEINWRYSGIGNVLRCLGIDIIYQYLYNLSYTIPNGEYEYCYSYTPVLLPKSGNIYKDYKSFTEH